MSARSSFRSVFMVASCAGAALGCYLVSLRVASERAALEDVETQIVLAQRDIRLLQTEIGTRGRLAQLERWNVKVLALSAPTADQFLKGGFELARMTTPERKDPIEAPVVLASAPINGGEPMAAPDRASAQQSPVLLHEASLKTSQRPSADAVVPAVERKVDAPAAAKVQPKKASDKPAPAAVSAKVQSTKTAAAKPAAKAKTEAAKPAPSTKATPAKSAARDPLAPLPDRKNVKVASGSSRAPAKPRESASKQ